MYAIENNPFAKLLLKTATSTVFSLISFEEGLWEQSDSSNWRFGYFICKENLLYFQPWAALNWHQKGVCKKLPQFVFFVSKISVTLISNII